MKTEDKTREQLLEEIACLKNQLNELETVKNRRMEIEDELKKSKTLLEKIINNIPNQVFWKSNDLYYLGCNQAFADVTGMGEPSSVNGKSDYDLNRDKTHAESYREWDKKIMDSGEAVINLEESYHNADGSEGTVLTSKVPLKDENEKVFGILGICTDITERKRIEKKNNDLIKELKAALSEVKTLGGLLPICANCKGIRDDKGYWKRIEEYLSEHSDADLTHSICPDCAKKLYSDL